MNPCEIIQQSLDFIECNIKEEITVDELCDMAGYSYTHYCRLFKHVVGMTTTSYILRRKLLYAVYEMSDGKSKLNIALDYGFETYAGFYKAFKREFSCSPTEFTKNHKGAKPYRINILQEEHIMISKSEIAKILTHWNLENETVTDIYNRNTSNKNENAFYVGDNYIIKFSADLGRIKKSINISNQLSVVELPCAKVIKTTDYNNYIQYGELFFIITERLTGTQLKCKDVYSNTNIALQIGESIAKLHNALKTFNDSEFDKVNICRNVLDSALPKVKEIIKLPKNFTEDYIKSFESVFERLPTQIVHRDINPSNMIFNNGEFKGFIDFDLSEVNIRIFDICYCATAILSETFTDNNFDNYIWLEIFNNIVNGYNNISPLTNEEKNVLKYVIYSIQIICITYFSQFDKYEDLTRINIDMLNWLVERFEQVGL